MMALLLTAVLAQGYYTPAEAEALFAQANGAYEKENYGAAKEAYLKLVEHGYAGPDVLFNLGTTALAAGDLGEAVLYLERAKRGGGRADDVEANLAVARSRQLDQVIGNQSEDTFLQRLVEATSDSLVGWTFVVSWAVAFGFLILLRFLPAGRRAFAVGLTAVAFLCAVPTGALLAAHVFVRETVVDGVVLGKSLAAHEFPNDNAKVSFEVHAGLKVRLLERSGAFVKIRLPNGLEGWTENKGVAEI